MDKEIWKEIKGADGGHQASSWGRIRSIDRLDARGWRLKGRVLGGNIHHSGYIEVHIKISGIRAKYRVHQLVAIAFLGHERCGMDRVVNHRDGNKLNNHINNLEIVTQRENSSTCFREDRDSFSSIYAGVSWSKRDEKWVAYIQVNGVNINLGSFEVELDASNAYQVALLNENNPEYFEALKPKYSSKYKHISFDKKMNKWRAYWYIDKIQKHIGSYDTEELAKIAQDAYKEANGIVE